VEINNKYGVEEIFSIGVILKNFDRGSIPLL